ncbi:MAG: M67 family metallopeptidase [Chloroflexota bacterium]
MGNMRLWLTPTQAESIGRFALDGRPEEVCGIIGGIGERAKQIVSIENSSPDPQRHFRLDDQAFAKAMFELEHNGLSLIGIYHSHPNGNPIPSQEDIQQSNYPSTACVIVGLRDGEPRLAAWEILPGRVNTVDLHVGINAPEPADSELSNAQKTAIILAAIIAVAFLLIVSISLLPPAPVIVTPLP